MAIVLWFTGLSGSGKTTLAEALKNELNNRGKKAYILDGDVVRNTLHKNFGFSREDIRENNRLIAELAREHGKNHDVVLVPVISPYSEDRAHNRFIVGEGYVEVFVDCPLSVCEDRDVKGLYKKARAGEIKNFIGVSELHPYERPENPDIVIKTHEKGIDESVDELVKEILKSEHE